MSSSEKTVSPSSKWTRRPRCSNSLSSAGSSDEQTAKSRTAQSLQKCPFGSIVTTEAFIHRSKRWLPASGRVHRANGILLHCAKGD